MWGLSLLAAGVRTAKKEKYLSINIREITPELIKLRTYIDVSYAASSEAILPLSQSSPLLFLIHCTRL